jgi:anti-anti-sigma factor
MKTPFSVNKYHEREGVVVLTVAGDIDESTDEALLGLIENCVRAAPVAELVMDLAHVTFLSAGGIRALLLGRDAVVARGGRFRVSNPHGIVRQVLQITELTRFLNVMPAAETTRQVMPAGAPRGAD